MNFYDSTRPELIPAGTHACLYYDGLYAATPQQAKRFAAVRWITVLGDYRHCGVADYEAGNAVYSKPGALRTWVKGRIDMHTRARVYCNRANLPKVRTQLEGLTYLVWIATLDGNKLSKDWTHGLWGVQFAGGETANYDTSVLYGVW
ncbi:MAG TPA: hypothetical protein VGJ50_04265 [Streptosporangiaceae bacterium]|jgi:hypothetical protein